MFSDMMMWNTVNQGNIKDISDMMLWNTVNQGNIKDVFRHDAVEYSKPR